MDEMRCMAPGVETWFTWLAWFLFCFPANWLSWTWSALVLKRGRYFAIRIHERRLKSEEDIVSRARTHTGIHGCVYIIPFTPVAYRIRI